MSSHHHQLCQALPPVRQRNLADPAVLGICSAEGVSLGNQTIDHLGNRGRSNLKLLAEVGDGLSFSALPFISLSDRYQHPELAWLQTGYGVPAPVQPGKLLERFN
ncbi:hypothetical protein D3C74_401410 [compost metagenome]